MYKHLFFDFNGTLINDLDLCLELLNLFLKEQGKKELSKDEYKMVFKFPIKQYYIDSGIDFNIESYESLSIRFIKAYQPRSMECGLFEGTKETLEKLKKLGYELYVLSASEKNNLLEQTNHYDITKYFNAVLGIDNIHAASKVDIAKEYMKKNNINPKEALFIGDTLHDFEVSKAMGVDCALVSCGHQAKSILEKANVRIISSIKDIFSLL